MIKAWLILTVISLFTNPTYAKLNVVTSTTTLKSLVQSIAGDKANVESITRGPQDPHFVEAKPSYMVSVRKADLIVAVGLELEIGWLPNILRGSRNPTLLDNTRGYLEAGSFIEPLEVNTGKVDRAMGDIHARGNPHFLLDPVRTMNVVKGIAKRMGDLNPENASAFDKSAQIFVEVLNKKHREWKSRIEKSKIKSVITYHKTLNYFLNRFQVEWLDSIEPKPGVPPTTKHVLQLIQKAKAKGTQCILVESFFEMTAAERIKKSVGVHIEAVPTEVDAVPGSSDYVAMIEKIVSAIENCGRSFGGSK